MRVQVRESLEEVEPGYLLGVIEINGARHHVELIRVLELNDDGVQEVWHPDDRDIQDNENESRMVKMQEYYEGCYDTMKVDGFDGDYICHIHPFDVS